VQFFAKSVKLFSIYRKLNNLSFYFDFWPCGQDHRSSFFTSAFLGYHNCAINFFIKIDQGVQDLSQIKYTVVMWLSNFVTKLQNFVFLNYHIMVIISCNFWQNRSGRSEFIANYKLFDLWFWLFTLWWKSQHLIF